MGTRPAIGLFVLLASMGGAALADDRQELPCLKETQRICPLVPVGLVQGCLQAHRDELSERCRKNVGTVDADIGRMDRDCAADAARLCPEQQTSSGQRAACLSEHRDSLSPACRKTFEAISEKK